MQIADGCQLILFSENNKLTMQVLGKASIDLQAFLVNMLNFDLEVFVETERQSNMAIDDLFLYDLSKYDVSLLN